MMASQHLRPHSRMIVTSLAVLWLANSASASSNPCAHAGTSFNCKPEDCPENCDWSTFHCTGNASIPNSLVCDHQEIFFGDVGRDVAVIVLLPFFLTLCSAAGIGGGGIVVPLLLLITQLPAYYSVPLSNTSVLAVVIVSFFIQVRSKHPDPRASTRPLIDFDVVLLLLPMALAGTVIGVLLNEISPEWLVMITIVVSMAYASYKSIRKGLDLRQHERHREGLQQQTENKLSGFATSHEDASEPTAVQELKPGGPSLNRSPSLKASEELESEPLLVKSFRSNQEIARGQLKARELHFPYFDFALTVLELLGLVALNFLRDAPSLGLSCGTKGYWAVTLSTFAYLLICGILSTRYVGRKYRKKLAANYEFVQGDIHYTNKRLYLYPLLSIASGLLAGFLGIGGGMILGPLLLEFGMIPLVSSATSSYMTLLTSVSPFVQYMALGRLKFGYAIVLSATGAAASMVGQLVLLGYVRRSGRNSLIAFVISAINVIATTLLLVAGGLDVADDVRNHEDLGFRSICD